MTTPVTFRTNMSNPNGSAWPPPETGQPVPGDQHAAARDAMVRVNAGDEHAFRELYDGHADLVYSVAIAVLRHEADARDVLQEVFLKIWNASERYDPGAGKVVSWFIIITRNRCRSRLRSSRRREALHQASVLEAALLASSAADAADLLLRQETAAAVQAALAALPPEQTEAVRLSFLHGLTHEETAGHLNVPLGTVKARIRRGLARMKAQLQTIREDHSQPWQVHGGA